MKEKIKKYGKKMIKFFNPATANRVIYMIGFAFSLKLGLEHRGADPYKMGILGMMAMIFLMINSMTYKIEDYYFKKQIAEDEGLPEPNPF